MMMRRAYMDHNATAPVRAEAAEAVARALLVGGNPSSVHTEGRAARKFVEEARVAVAALVHAKPAEVVFTSGGTEAANLALHIARAALGVERVILSAIEHDCVRASAAALGLPVEILRADAQGLVDLDDLARRLDTPGKALVALMFANNETGVIQPIAAAARMARQADAVVFTDAIQALGRMPVDFQALDFDMMSMSAHKLGGPQGVGALVVRDGLPFEALIRGGGQESRRRSGTENVPGIAGFGAAAKLAAREIAEMPRVQALRDRLEAALRGAVADVQVFGDGAPRLANTSLFSAPGLDAETLLMTLDLDGFAVSAGSACSSGKVARSHVLAAMGVDDVLARGAIRVSLGLTNTEEEIDRLALSWSRAAIRARDKVKSSTAGAPMVALAEVES
ncbi:cysteine desulfurase family protein [Parvibaculum sp.]|uniref:cysteine desulfurase family protein n=1 Tax=Parvibaculum sp. TaxID=2024848 RepID=UPI002CC7D36D|nr:cysteine desulfurase family protein [Parvibaculum sp.]HUD52686.1 cysteine desulfurase family protein [Parvibaculum sp.]